MQARIDEILRERAMMGGCGDEMCGYGEGDYDGMFGSSGVYAGRARRRVKRGPSHNPWIEHVKDYAYNHGISYREALSEAGPSYSGGVGTHEGALKGWVTRRANKALAKTKKVKRAPSKRAKKSVGKRIPAGYKLNLRTGRLNKLKPRELARVGKRYQSRTAKKVCRKEDNEGRYYLNRNYRCVSNRQYQAAKKKRS
jgi:hypothetical protein